MEVNVKYQKVDPPPIDKVTLTLTAEEVRRIAILSFLFEGQASNKGRIGNSIQNGGMKTIWQQMPSDIRDAAREEYQKF